MSVGNFDNVSFDIGIGGFDGDTGDTHDGWKQRTTERGAGFDDERHARRGEEQARLRAMLEAAFAPQSEVRAAAEIRAAAAPIAERLESGALQIDWQGLTERAELAERLQAFQAAFEAWQEQLEEESELMLLGSLH